MVTIKSYDFDDDVRNGKTNVKQENKNVKHMKENFKNTDDETGR